MQLKDAIWDYGGNLISLLWHVAHNPLISQHLVLRHVVTLIYSLRSPMLNTFEVFCEVSCQYFNTQFLRHPSQNTDCFTTCHY